MAALIEKYTQTIFGRIDKLLEDVREFRRQSKEIEHTIENHDKEILKISSKITDLEASLRNQIAALQATTMQIRSCGNIPRQEKEEEDSEIAGKEITITFC